MLGERGIGDNLFIFNVRRRRILLTQATTRASEYHTYTELRVNCAGAIGIVRKRKNMVDSCSNWINTDPIV